MAGSLHPVPLNEIAGHLRDGTWLDVRVFDDERDWITLENVKVTEYVIRRHNEQVTVVQQWAAEDDSMQRQEMALDAEAIRWVRPTEHDPTTVTPYETFRVVVDGGDEWGIVLQVVAQEQNCEVSELVGRLEEGLISARYLTIMLAFHATEMAPEEICKRVGYASVQPFHSARHKYREDNDFKNRLRLMAMVARQKGCSGRAEERRGQGWLL